MLNEWRSTMTLCIWSELYNSEEVVVAVDCSSLWLLKLDVTEALWQALEKSG